MNYEQFFIPLYPKRGNITHIRNSKSRKRKSLVFLAALLITAQTAWAQVTVTTVDGLLEAVKTSQTITLGADITTLSSGGRLDINNGITVTLDLNGHTLKREMTAVHPGGQAIIVNEGGNLTIMDSGSGGTITGGWANGGGIYVREGGVLTITGGTISGNTATDGGGICNEGTATIKGVTISGNTVSSDGGGIGVWGTANGSVVLTDVTITDNTAQANGGGISLFKPEAQNCTVELKGACTITGNTATLFGGGIYHHGFGTYRPGPTLKMQETPVVQDNTPPTYILAATSSLPSRMPSPLTPMSACTVPTRRRRCSLRAIRPATAT